MARALFLLLILLVKVQGIQAAIDVRLGRDDRSGAGGAVLRQSVHVSVEEGTRFYGPNTPQGIPPQLSLEKQENIESVRLSWPEPHTDQGFYTRDFTAYLEIKKKDPRAPAAFEGVLTGLYCDDQCVPYKVPLKWQSAGGGFSLTLLILFGFLGGALLNFMPCVLPVLSLKLLPARKKELKSLKKTMGMTLIGILLFFLVSGVVISIFREFGQVLGWGFYFQNPYFITFFAWFMLVLGAKQLGFLSVPNGLGFVLPIQVSQWVKDGLDGFLLAVIATPCTAPFLGLVSGVALTAPIYQIFLIFLAVGCGFGVPYILFLVFPKFLMKKIPKPGAWMTWVEKAMGYLLVFSGFWALWILSQHIKWLGIFLFLGLFLTILGVGKWLKWTPRRVILGSFLVFLGPFFALKEPKKESFDPQIRVLDLKKRALEKQVILVTVSARWCLNCHYNEWILKKKAVQDFLTKNHVHVISLDWTNQEDSIRSFLESHGRTGIPFSVIYGPGMPNGKVLPELLSFNALMQGVQVVSGLPAYCNK